MINLNKGKLWLEQVVIEDSDVIKFFTSIKADEGEEIESLYQDYLLRALKIGVMAIQRSQTQVDIDAIRHEFDELHQQMDRSLDAIFNKDRGDLITSMVKYLGEDGKMSRLLEDTLTGDGSQFSRLLDYTEQQSPLKKLHETLEKKFKEIEDRVIEVQKQITGEQRAEEEAERGTRQGVEFEVILGNILDDQSRPFNDVVSSVGLRAEDGGSKKGDLLIEVNPQDTDGKKAVILVEAKRNAGKTIGGKNGILAEIDCAKLARQADFAIAVYSEDACPAEVGGLRDYGNNRVICSIPSDGSEHLALDLAYRLARIEVCWQMRHASGGIDRVQVSGAMKMIQEKLKNFTGIKQKASNMKSMAEGLRTELDVLEQDIKKYVDQVLRELLDESEPEALGAR